MEQRLTEYWYGERTRPVLLEPLAWAYGALLAARRRAYAARWLTAGRAGKPVVVVGNLTVGGTGKTPLTLWLAGELGARRLAVGIVSRGYGGSAGRGGRAPLAVGPGSDWREVGDEPLLLARRSGCPTIVGRDRLAAARALAPRVDVILADDGLQHLHLARDCEIVVIDGARGFGNGHLLPAGPLREPLARLAQSDAVVVNGSPVHASLAPALARLAPLAMSLAAHEAIGVGAGAGARAGAKAGAGAARRPLATFRGTRVHAVAGIGNPARFFALLRAQGIEVIEHAFADHHPFAAAELEFGDDLPVLMTEKDAVKCAAFAHPRLWYVPVAAELSAPDAHELLRRVLGKVRGAAA